MLCAGTQSQAALQPRAPLPWPCLSAWWLVGNVRCMKRWLPRGRRDQRIISHLFCHRAIRRSNCFHANGDVSGTCEQSATPLVRQCLQFSCTMLFIHLSRGMLKVV